MNSRRRESREKHPRSDRRSRREAREGSLRAWEWLSPYVGWVLLGLGASFAVLAGDEAAAAESRRIDSFASLLLAVGGVALTSLLLVAAARRRSMAVFATLYAGLVVSVGVLTASLMLAPEDPAQSRLQTSLREVVERRSRESTRLFHGTLLHEKTNRNGWEDDEPRPEASRHYAFIGDSFLEVQSSRNLARRVEALLRGTGIDVEITNLSIQDSDLLEYRHRLYEVALPAAPERIFVFLFALNDLAPDFRYEPYVHPAFWVSRRAEKIAAGVSPDLGSRMRRMRLSGQSFRSRAEFLSHLEGSPYDLELVYLATLAYSQPPAPERALSARVVDLARRTASVLWRGLSSLPGASGQRGATGKGSGCVESPWVELWGEYQAIFELPKSERLQAIGEFVGQRYCGRADAGAFVRRLKRQSGEFQEYLVEEAEMPYFLFPALAEAVRAEETKPRRRRNRDEERAVAARAAEGSWARKVDEPAVESAALEYTKLVAEMRDAATRRGVGFTLVLIPEPSMVDSSFATFWSGLCRFEERFAPQHALHRALVERLRGKVDMIDLAAVSGLLDGGYWPVDGHFNEHGNRRVAEVIAGEMKSY